MKKERKIRAIYYVSVIFFVFVLLGLLLVKAYSRTNIILTDKTIERIETSAYNYITKNEDNSDIVSLRNGKLKELYIPVEEIANKGFIEEEYNINGIIKVTYDDDYKITYERNKKNYLTVIFHANDDILSYYAKTLYCENNDYLKCVKNLEMPLSTSEKVNIKGYTLNSNYQDMMIDNKENLYTLLKNNDYKVKNNKLNIYAITNRIFTMTVDNTLLGIDNKEISCEALNWEESCFIKLPKYSEYKNIEFNTKKDNKGYKFFEEEKYTLTKNETIYTIPDYNEHTITANSYLKNGNKIDLLFIIDNSHSMEAYNSLGNVKTVINKNLKILATDNINYKLLSVGADASLKTEVDNLHKFKKSINNLEVEGYYNKGTVESKIVNYIGENDIIIVFSTNEVNIETPNKVYSININNDNVRDEYTNYYYHSNDDDIDLTTLNSQVKAIFSDINNNNSYIFDSSDSLEVKDNEIILDTQNINNMFLKLDDRIYVIDNYLIPRNNKIYFDLKSFMIDNLISIDKISEIEIEYVK